MILDTNVFHQFCCKDNPFFQTSQKKQEKILHLVLKNVILHQN